MSSNPLRLKSLTMNGFKSFADKTTFEFHDGMTILVGPNGCGKSNLVDAIKWVLGDQSAKSIRGKDMIDVIFNGSEKRPPTGFAEVSLNFDNTGRVLPLDLDEVSITRRLYRNGESEYETNKRTCRLRDIKELFMDTGIGVSAYSLIEQGRVASFISSNAKERRQLFEEAAGITRLKTRKKEAQAKLNRSKQNLERLHDIVQEVSRRLATVKRQAAKAQKHKEFSVELKEKRVMVSVLDYSECLAEKKKSQSLLEELESSLSQLQTTQAEIDVRRSEVDDEFEQSSGQLNAVATTLVRIDGEIQRLSDLLEVNATRHEEIKSQKSQRQEHRQELEGRLKEVEQALEIVVKKSEGSEERIESCKKDVRLFEQNMEEQEEKLITLSGEIEELRGRISAMEIQSHRLEQLETVSKQRLGEMQREKEEAASKSRDFELKSKTQAEEQQLLESKLEELEGHKQALMQRLDAQERKVTEVKNQRDELDDNLTEVRLEESRYLTEMRLLEDFQKQSVGVEEAVKSLLIEGQNDQTILNGIVGLAADLISSPPELSSAVDAVLSIKAQTVVVENHQVIETAEKILQTNDKGQVSFMALDNLPPVPSAVLLSDDVVHEGRLIDKLTIDESYRQVMEHLLGEWYVLPEDSNFETLPDNFCAVTLSGRRRDNRGRHVRGSAVGNTGLVSRRSALNDMTTRLSDLKVKETDLEQQLEALEDQGKEQEQSRSATASELMEKENDIAGKKSDLKFLNSERELLSDRILRLNERLQSVEDDIARIENESLERQQKLEVISESLLRDRLQHKELKDKQESELLGQGQARENLVNKRMELARMEHEWQVLSSTRKQHEDLKKEATGDLERLTEEDMRITTVLQQLVSESESSRQSIDGHFNSKKEKEEELTTVKTKHHEIQEKKVQIDKEHSSLFPQLKELQTKIHEQQSLRQEAVLRLENLIDRVRDEYNMELEELASNWEGPSKEDIDFDQVKEECTVLRKQIEKLGNVNLEALQEEGEQTERYTFLANQERDLKEASRKLEEVIQKIDTRARETFIETYEMVKENFKISFRQLFGGGRADIKMEEGEDILDAGIEITACPPGKEPRSITLLSGGEKTMTAVALLFAIFRSRPSPFCVLDEVDAALDESNIDRWLNMLNQFSEKSQFLVVSHNKRTMRAGSMIYGVTMQEPGVSRKLSLKFEELDQNEDLRDLNPDNKEVA